MLCLKWPVLQGGDAVHAGSAEALTGYDYWNEGFECLKSGEGVPIFLRKLLRPLYVAGRTLNALKRSGYPMYYQFCDTLPEDRTLILCTRSLTLPLPSRLLSSWPTHTTRYSAWAKALPS